MKLGAGPSGNPRSSLGCMKCPDLASWLEKCQTRPPEQRLEEQTES
jgi:hypothetical protein